MNKRMMDNKPWLTLSSPWLLTTMLALPSTAVQAQMFTDEEEDPYEFTPLVTQRVNQFNSEVELLTRYQNNDAVKFGEYNGLENQGLSFGASVLLDKRDYEGGSARYYWLNATDLGTEIREIEVEMGRQSDYELRFNYDEMERQVWGDFTTPYDISNDRLHTLPVEPGSQGDSSAADYKQLIADFADRMRSYKLEMDRESLGVGGTKQLGKGWSISADVKREVKEGHKDYALYSPITVFALPIDYTTDTLDLTLEHTADNYHLQLAYGISSFQNDHNIIVLEDADAANRFNGLAQEPDNLYQVLSVNGNYRFSPMTRANWYLAYSKSEQDEELLNQSVNGDPVQAARDNAEARMDKVIARLGISSRITRDLTLGAKYNYQDNDHKTDVYSATYLSLDATAAPPKQPKGPAVTPEFDTTWESIALDGSYRLPNRSKLRAGFEYEEVERPDQDREVTREDTYWVSWSSAMMGSLSTSLKYTYAERDGGSNDADVISAIVKADPTTDQHPDGAFRFYLADRIQNKVQANATYAFNSRASLGAMMQLWEDDYHHTGFGLQKVVGELYTVDLSMRPARTYGISLYTGLQRFEYDQRSRATPSGADPFDWHQTTKDGSWIAGITLDWEAIPNKVLMKFGYRYVETEGEIDQSREDAASVVPLPDLETTIHTFQLAGEYFLDKQTTLLARAVYEDYESANWAFDNLGPIADFSNRGGGQYLTGGLDSPDHHVALIELGVRYQF